MNGILNIFKPEGITSNGVINEIKKISGEKKIGHIGTLDPLAKGVLPLFLGKMTKLIPYFNLDQKAYRAIATLGFKSTTLDREGDFTSIPIPENCDEHNIKTVLKSFEGEIKQIPPMFSAVKIKGKRLYQYARQGENIERPPRKIIIYQIDHIKCLLPDIHFEVRCSKGTFIRTLVDDLAIKLGTGGYLKELTRIQCGQYFNEQNSLKLDQIKKINKTDLQKNFIDPEYILMDWHIVEISSIKLRQYISQGRQIPVPLDDIRFSESGKHSSKTFVRFNQNELIAVGCLEFSQDSDTITIFRPTKVFI